jgi:hypothetical protein
MTAFMEVGKGKRMDRGRTGSVVALHGFPYK